MNIEELIERNGDAHCEGCPYYRTYTESHPYGMGYAVESLWECDAACDSQCPALKLFNDEEDEKHD